MQSCFRIEGTDCALWLSRSAAGYRLHTDADPPGVAIAIHDPAPANGTYRPPSGPGPARLLLTVAGESMPVVVAQSGDQLFVHLHGRAYALTYLDPVQTLGLDREGAREDTILAPMPGMVLAISVKPGDIVAAGDPLVVIESMKVQTNLAAGRAGVVAAVHVSAGQSFDRGSVLVTLAKGE